MFPQLREKWAADISPTKGSRHWHVNKNKNKKIKKEKQRRHWHCVSFWRSSCNQSLTYFNRQLRQRSHIWNIRRLFPNSINVAAQVDPNPMSCHPLHFGTQQMTLGPDFPMQKNLKEISFKLFWFTLLSRRNAFQGEIAQILFSVWAVLHQRDPCCANVPCKPEK